MVTKYETWHKLKEPLPEVDEAGTKYWCNKDGEFHRANGPAVVFRDGTEIWYKNGEPHRADGPAYFSKEGGCDWYLNGRLVSEKEFNKLTCK